MLEGKRVVVVVVVPSSSSAGKGRRVATKTATQGMNWEKDPWMKVSQTSS